MDIKITLKEARDAIKNKDFKTALKLSKAVLREDKYNYMGLIFLGISLQETGFFDQAPKAFKKAIEINSNNILAWNGLASYYEKHSSVNPELIPVYMKLLNLESNNAKLIEILKKLSAFAVDEENNLVAFVNSLEAVTSNDKTDSSVRIEAFKLINMVLHKFTGKIPDVLLNIYEESFANLVGNSDTVTTDLFAEYLKLLNKLRKYEKLMEVAQNMFEYNEFNFKSLEWMCKIYGELYIEGNDLYKNYKNIILPVPEKLLRLQSDSVWALIVNSIFLYDEANLIESVDILKKATSSKTKSVYAWIFLTKCYNELYLYNDAIQSGYKAEKLLNSTENKNPILKKLLDQYLCRCLSESQDEQRLKDSVKLCQTVIENHPEDNQIIIKYLIQTYINLENYNEATNWIKKIENNVVMRSRLLTSQKQFNEALEILEGNPQETAEYFHEIGDIYWNFKKYDKALIQYLNAAKLDSNSYISFLKLGRLYKNLGNLDKARRCYEKSFRLNSKCVEAGIDLSKIYRKLQKWEENLNLLQSLTTKVINSNNKWANIQLGIHYLEQEDYLNAITSLRLVIRTDPANSNCWESLADAYLQRGAYTSALKSYQKAADIVPESLYPKLQIATIKMILGEYVQARIEFENVLKVDRTYIPALKGIAETCLYQAKHFYRMQLHGLARDCLQCAINNVTIALKEQGDLSCLWKIIANSFYLAARLPEKFCYVMVAAALSEGRNEKGTSVMERKGLLILAARCYCKALNLSKGNVLLYHDLACCFFIHAKYSENEEEKEVLFERASAAIEHCLLNNGSYWQHWNLLGIISFFREPKNLPLAQHSFIQAVSLDYNCAMAWCNLGAIYMYIGEVKLGNEAFSQAQRADPNYVNSWVGQAVIAEGVGVDDSMDLFRHSTQLGAHKQGAVGYAYWVCSTLLNSPLDTHIYAIHNMHAIPVACDALTWYVEKHPKDSCAWNMLGILNERMGLKQTACNAYKKSWLLSNPPHHDQISINYARSLYNLKQYGEAINIYKQVREASFNSGSGLALALFKAEQYEESYEAYEAALHWLTEEASQQSDLLVALASMAYLFQGPEPAKTLLLQSTQVNYRSSWGLYATLALGLLHDDLALAQLVLKEIEDIKDDITCLPHYSLLLGCTYLLQGENIRAVRELSKLVHQYPNESSLWLNLAMVLLRIHPERKVDSSVAKCALAAKLLAQNKMDISKVLCIISLSSVLSGDAIQALKSTQNAIHCYPHLIEGWSLLACALKLNKSPKKQIEMFKTFVANSV